MGEPLTSVGKSDTLYERHGPHYHIRKSCSDIKSCAENIQHVGWRLIKILCPLQGKSTTWEARTLLQGAAWLLSLISKHAIDNLQKTATALRLQRRVFRVRIWARGPRAEPTAHPAFEPPLCCLLYSKTAPGCLYRTQYVPGGTVTHCQPREAEWPSLMQSKLLEKRAPASRLGGAGEGGCSAALRVRRSPHLRCTLLSLNWIQTPNAAESFPRDTHNRQISIISTPVSNGTAGTHTF